MIRPERVGVEPAGADGENRLPGLVEHAVFLGSFRELRVRILGGSLIKVVAAERRGAARLRAGSRRDAPPAVRTRCASSRLGRSGQPEPPAAEEPAEEPETPAEPEEESTDGN